MNIEGLLLTRLFDNNSMLESWEQGLRREVFEDPLNRSVYEFIENYWLGNSMVLVPTREIIKYEFPGWKPEENVEESTTWLIETLKKRLASNRAQELMRSAAQKSSEDPVGALNELFEGSWLTKQTLLSRANRSDLSLNVEERRKRYTERLEEKGEGAPLGFDEVDQHTRGIKPGELAAVAGFAKKGKSWTLVNSAIAARREGFTPCVFTLEMTVEEFEDRLDATASGVGAGKLLTKTLDFAEQNKLRESQEELASLGSLFIERPERGERSVQYLVNRARQLGADYLIIDQLSFMESNRNYMSTSDKHAEIIHDLKEEISNTANGSIPTLLAVQFNRGSVSTPGTRGGLHNIANSSAIEQTVDIAYGLYRNKEMETNNCMILDILGSRRSDKKSWMLEWQLKDQTRFGVRSEYDD